MKRIAVSILGLTLASFAQAPAARVQDAGHGQDPIAAAIAGGDATAPAKPQTHAFSPRDISDLLSQDKPKPRPASTSAVPKAIDPPGAIPGGSGPTLANARAPLNPDAVNAARFSRVDATSRNVDPIILKAEILLDRAHAPPGVIDGRYGSNFLKAIRTFEEVRGLEVDGKLTRRVWDELGGDTAAPVLGTYTIKPEDVVGPFYPDLSPDYAEQAKLPDLGYRSAEEMFGERFHMDRKFLRAMNPGVDMAIAGNAIVVAQVDAIPLATPITRIDVDKGKGQGKCPC